MKLLKSLIYLIFVLIVLAILVPVLLMIFVNPNQFKSQIQEEVTNAIHRPFSINGDLHWSLFPVLGIKADNIAIGNPDGFVGGQGTDFLSAKTVELSVAVQPLLHKEVRVGKIEMDGLNIHLIKNASGKVNWQLTSGSTTSTTTTTHSSSHTSSKVIALSVSRVNIKDSQIVYDDETQNKHMVISDFNMESQNIDLNQSFPVSVSMTVTDNSLPNPLHIQWKSDVKVQLPGTINISNMRATLNKDLTVTGSESVVMGKTPAWKANLNFSNINIGSLLKLFKKTNLDITGTGDVTADVSGKGSDLNTLNGNVKFAVHNGIFHGIDLYYYSDVADALTRHERPASQDTHQTPFGDLTGTLQIQNGVASNKDLLLQATKITASGQGTANLVSQQLDYRLSLQRMTSGTKIEPRGPAVPITITGPFAKPVIGVDLKSVVVSEVKSQLQEQVKKYSPEINQKIQQGLQSLLGN